MDPSDAHLVLRFEPTLFLRPGSFVVVFLRVTEALWLFWPSWVGTVGLGGAAAPGGSVGPRWCGRPYLLVLMHLSYGLFD
jgi:hypothetical protein